MDRIQFFKNLVRSGVKLVAILLLAAPIFAEAGRARNQTARANEVRQGTVSSGGGAVACIDPRHNDGSPVLLDLIHPQNRGIDRKSSVDFLNKPENFYEFFYASNMRSYRYAEGVIRKWRDELNLSNEPFEGRSNLGFFIDTIRQSISHIQFIAITCGIPMVNEYYVQDTYSCAALTPVVYYNSGFAFLDISAWNNLGLRSKVGVLIHEGLRFMQLSLRLPISNKDMQDLTQALLSDDRFYSTNPFELIRKTEYFRKFREIGYTNISMHTNAHLNLISQTYNDITIYPLKTTDTRVRFLRYIESFKNSGSCIDPN